MPDLELPRKLGPLITTPKRFKVIYGGRGGGKSQGIAKILLMKAQTEGLKIGCFREFYKSIEDSVYSLLLSEIDKLELQGFSHTNSTIRESINGGEFKFDGLARNPTSIKSKEGFNIFWVEEAQTLSKISLELLTPTLREAGSECWFSLNPSSSADPVSQRFLKPFESELLEHGFYEDDEHLIIKINYQDNPWFPNELEMERKGDEERLSKAEYDHKWLGYYNDSVDNAIIPSEWFDAAIDAHVKLGFEPVGQIVASLDPSDQGNDAKGYALRHGSVFLDIDYKEDGDFIDGFRWGMDKALEANADLFTWDGDGIGAGGKLQVQQALDGKSITYQMFKGSETADNPDEYYLATDNDSHESSRTNKQIFKNKRAQYAWMLRDRFFNTYRAVHKGEYIDPDKMISLSSSIPRLNEIRAEFCRIPRKMNPNGQIQIMSKPEMKKMGIESPNMFDAAMMALVTSAEDDNPMSLNFRSEF